jgi:uncharacterized repeat protein (TIGR01451 family)
MGKRMFSLVVVSFLLIFTASVVYGQGTARGTAITNTAKVTAANVTAAVTASAPSTNVRRIVGAYYSVIPADVSAGAGQTVNLIFTVFNYGNQAESFVLALSNVQSNAGPWTKSFKPSATLPIIAAGASTSFTLQVQVAPTATNNSYQQYRVVLSGTNLTTAVRARRYRGDNGTFYGGDMGIAWDPGTTNNDGRLRHGVSSYGATTNKWIRITVQGPVLNITKSILSVTLGGAASLAVPGATITYQVKVSNAGTGAANAVKIIDSVPANTTYVANSATITSNPGGFTINNANPVVCSNNAVGALPAGAGNGSKVVFQYSVTIN